MDFLFILQFICQQLQLIDIQITKNRFKLIICSITNKYLRYRRYLYLFFTYIITKNSKANIQPTSIHDFCRTDVVFL